MAATLTDCVNIKELAFTSMTNRSVLTDRDAERLMARTEREKTDMLDKIKLPVQPVASYEDMHYAWMKASERDPVHLKNTAGVSRKEADRFRARDKKRAPIGRAPKTPRPVYKSKEFVDSDADDSEANNNNNNPRELSVCFFWSKRAMC